MQGNSPIQGTPSATAFQQPDGLKNETEKLVIRRGGKDQNVEVGRKKGKLGVRFIRKLAGLIKPKVNRQKAPATAQTSGSKFAECCQNGKVAKVPATPMMKTPDFAKMPYGELQAMARNPDVSTSLQHQALEAIGEFKADLFDVEAGTPSPDRVKQQQTRELKKEGYSDDQIQHILKGFGKAIGIELVSAQEQPVAPAEEGATSSAAKEKTSESPLPDITKDSADVQKAKNEQLQQQVQLAVDLANTDNLTGLNELLNSTNTYKKIDFIGDQLKSQFGEDSPAYQQITDRLTELKPQQLIDQAKSEGLYDESEISQFAAKALAGEERFSAVADSIQGNVDKALGLEPAPQLPPRTDEMNELVDTAPPEELNVNQELTTDEEPATELPPKTETTESQSASISAEPAEPDIKAEEPPSVSPKDDSPSSSGTQKTSDIPAAAQSTQTSPLQQLADDAISLAKSGDLVSLQKLLISSSEYKEIQFVKNQLKEQLGRSNNGYKLSVSRLITLKPQDLINKAAEAGITEPSEVKQFAAEAIARESSYNKLADTVLKNLDTLLEATQPAPASQTSSTSKPTADSIIDKLYAGGFKSSGELLGEIYSLGSIPELQALDEWARESYDDLEAISGPLQAIQEEITRLSPSFRPPQPPRDTVSVQ